MVDYIIWLDDAREKDINPNLRGQTAD